MKSACWRDRWWRARRWRRPTLIVHTLTEYADQVRRIMRVSKLSLFVDADHGYGNALNVMRTVQEFEHAGLSGLGIEDTTGPLAFGQDRGSASRRWSRSRKVSEKCARHWRPASDPSLVIIGRTPALRLEGIESAVARAKAYAAAGVDVIFIAGQSEKLEHIRGDPCSAKLPILCSENVGSVHARRATPPAAPAFYYRVIR